MPKEIAKKLENKQYPCGKDYVRVGGNDYKMITK